MDNFEVTFDELDALAQQLTDCADQVAAAAALIQGLAPGTGRSDSATMAANAANALHQDLTATRSTLARFVELLTATAQAYRSGDDGVAALLTVGGTQ